MVLRKAGEQRGKGSAWTKGVRSFRLISRIRGQASEAVLNTAWQEAAERWVDYVWWGRRQTCMERVVGLEHSIRQEGIGDRVAWGKWCYEDLRRGEFREKGSQAGRVREHGVLTFSSAVAKAALF